MIPNGCQYTIPYGVIGLPWKVLVCLYVFYIHFTPQVELFKQKLSKLQYTSSKTKPYMALEKENIGLTYGSTNGLMMWWLSLV